MAFTDTLNTIPNQFLDALEMTQQLILTNASATAATARAFTPALPAVPFADRLPNAVSLTDNAFDFATKVLASQRDFSVKLISTWLPEAAAQPTPAKPAAK